MAAAQDTKGERRGASVQLEALSKSYRGTSALDSVSLHIAPGSFVSLLGPSGSGKTTALNLIAGFLTPDSGRVLFDGEPVSTIPPHRRDIGMVFQSYALFPHLTVFGNVAYPLRMRTALRGAALHTRVAETLELVQLTGKEQRYPRQLSGGQQQRVAMARALVSRPRLLLMDEPLGALDKSLRADLQAEIKDIHRKLATTFLYVTHDQSEALTLSDTLVVMRNGRIAQMGAPSDVYERPNSRFVAAFLGDANLIPVVYGGVRHGAEEWLMGGTVRLPSTENASAGASLPVGAAATLLIRPEDLHCRVGAADGEAMLQGTLLRIAYSGNSCKLTVRLVDVTVDCLAHPADAVGMTPGQHIVLGWNPARAVILPAVD